MKNRQVLVLDFGSEYTPFFGKHFDDINIKYEIVPHDISIAEIVVKNPGGLILSGSPDYVHKPLARRPASGIFELDLPILGVCYGMQLMADALGGAVERSQREDGLVSLTLSDRTCPLFDNMPKKFTVHMDHDDVVTQLPQGFIDLGNTDLTPIAVMSHTSRPLFGLQFHLESPRPDNNYGRQILQNFMNL